MDLGIESQQWEEAGNPAQIDEHERESQLPEMVGTASTVTTAGPSTFSCDIAYSESPAASRA